MARHIYRYRLIVDECPCSSDGRPSSGSVSTTVPVFHGRSAPVYPISYPINQQTVVSTAVYHSPNQHPNFSYPHYPIPQQPINTQQYYYDNNGNMIPVAVAVPV
jgi:hypothetical protein